jgi:hypothetical protein
MNVFQSFFEIGTGIGFGLFLFSVIPSLLFYKFIIKKNR